MSLRSCILAVAMAGCGHWSTISRVPLVTANVLLVEDYKMTVDASDGGRWDRFRETNMVLGDQPSLLRLTTWNAAWFVGMIGAQKLPPWARFLIGMTVTAIQVDAVRSNHQQGVSF